MANIVLNTSNVTKIKYVHDGITTNITEVKYKKGSGTATSVWSSTPELPPELGINYTIADRGTYFAITVTLSKSKPTATSGSFDIIPYGRAVLGWGDSVAEYSTGNLINFGSSASVSKTINVNKNIIRTAGFKITGSDNFMSAEKIGEFPIVVLEGYDQECPQITSASSTYLNESGVEKTRVTGIVYSADNYETNITLACFDSAGTRLGSTTLSVLPGDNDTFNIDVSGWYGEQNLILKIVGVEFANEPNIFICDMREADDQFYYNYVERTFTCKISHILTSPTITLTFISDTLDPGDGNLRDYNHLYLDIKDNNSNKGNVTVYYTVKSGTASSFVTDANLATKSLASGGQTRITIDILERKAGQATVYVSKPGFIESSAVYSTTSDWDDSTTS